MEPWELALRIVLLGLSVIMLIISVQAFRRARDRRMLWVLISFMGFVVLSGLALIGEFNGEPTWAIPDHVVMLLVLIIGANYLALLKG